MANRRTRTRRSHGRRRGVALLVVLFVVMAVSVLSMGFIAHSDAQLQCGRNTRMHMQVDYTAQGGLAHARAVVLNGFPTPMLNVAGQVDTTSNDHYLFSVYSPVVTTPADPNDPAVYTYAVDCEGYRNAGGVKTARVKYRGQLHCLGLPPHTRAFYKSLQRVN